MELRAKARRLKMHQDIKLIILDYMQLMRGTIGIENRQQEISEISRSLKALARELNVPVVAISQLSRAVESRTDHRPQLSDLRESGAIEQDADVVVLLLREEYYSPTPDNQGVAEVIIAKQRNGPVGTLKLAFIKEYTRFENIARIE
jgi:replicative DNA helicase